jgi:hypothetical protein
MCRAIKVENSGVQPPRRMSEVQILRAAIKIFTVMAHWKDLTGAQEQLKTRLIYKTAHSSTQRDEGVVEESDTTT